MEELLNKVAEIRGMPASLVQRSAEARAEKEGTTLEAVLLEWAGESAEAAPAAAAPSEAEPQAPEATPQPSPETATAVVPGEVTTDYLIKLAAEAKRMPPKLILTSAEARATHAGTSVDQVLAGWAGVDLDELKAKAAEAPETVTTEMPQEPAPDEGDSQATPAAKITPPEPEIMAAAAGAAASISMDTLLEQVAEAKGMPAALAKRSAEARAKKTGEPLVAVLAEWAGVDPATVSEASAPEPQPAPAPTPPPEPASDDATEEAEAEGEVEVLEATPADETTVPVAAATASRYPAWLAAAFILIPLLAVTYILMSPNGPDCGTSAQLLVDPVTGNAVNCDGSEYGTVVVDYFANGAAIYAQCQACHGTDGGGGSGFPAFTGGSLLTTFPEGSCSDQVEWITLGTAGWPEPTYGATNKPVGGVGLMPAFGTTLEPEQIAEVALYERVQFGAQDLAAAQADCGFETDHGEDGDGGSVEASGS